MKTRHDFPAIRSAVKPGSPILGQAASGSVRVGGLRLPRNAEPFAKAFTLAEILVAIAIIGILAAVLIPATGHRRNAALTAASINNLRQVHLLMQTYLNDHNGDYPMSVDQTPRTPPLDYEPTWRRVIWENANGPFPADVMAGMKTTAYSKIMWCPLMVKRYGQLEHPCGQGSYSLNRFFMPPEWGGGMRRIHRSDVTGKEEPYIMAGTTLASDRRIGTFYHLDSSKFPYDTEWSNLNYAYGTRGDQAIGAFIDGHVEAISRQKGIGLDPLLSDRTSLK